MNKITGIVAGGLLFTATSCSNKEVMPLEDQQWQISTAVEEVAINGGKPFAIDKRVPCDFGLLVGNLVVARTLADETDYKAVIVKDSKTGIVPEFGLVDCFEDENGVRIIRGNDGW